ncbi:MAG: Ig-like domain-containing protein [Carnobacterium sp.]|nr:Ig-like domain-containing protein [Carnobacterium sp.]
MKEIFNTKQRFSIRKFSFGVASVLVGLTWLAPTSTAQVEENTSTTQQTTTVLSTTQTQGTPETTEPATTVAPSVQEEETTAEETMVAPEASTTGKRRGKRDVSGATQQPTVEFLNENNQVVDPNAVFDGKTGLNMQIKVRVTFQENATEKKATIKLGNLLTLADTGANNDSLKPFLKGVSSLSKPITNLTTPDGQKYRNSTNESDAVLYMGDTVTYSFNDNVKSVVIPLTVNRHLITGLKGVSAAGTINGSTEGIEKSTPITVEQSQKDTDGQVVTGSSALNAIDFKDSGDANRTLNLWFNSVTSVPGFETANTNNGYTVVLGITINNSSQSTLAPMFVDSVTFDMVLPKGIRYEGMARYENNFEKISESTDASGVTTIKFKRNNPYYGTTFRFNPKLKVDTNIYTESTGEIHIKDYTVQLRNYPASKDFIQSGYKDKIYSFPIIQLTEQDDINFFRGVIGVFDNTSDSVAVAPVNGKQYVALGRFPFDSVARTLDDVNSREKELFYEFPTNPHFEVKGIQLPGIDNNKTITKVKVASKKNPVLHEVTLATPYNTAGSNAMSPPRFIDVKDLGLDDDDVLTQLVVPIGSFEAGKSYIFGGINKAKENQVFGKFLTPTDNYEVSTKLTLRDKDFDENDPNHNWKTGTGVMKVRLSKNSGRNDLRIITPGNKTINYAKSDKITYEIRSDRANYSHFQRVTDLVDKAHLVLPEDVDVKSIRLKDQDGNDFTNEVTITTKVENGKKIHTIDFAGVSDDKKILGWVGSVGKPFEEKFMKVEVEVENNVASNKNVNYDQTLFVTTPEANVRPLTGNESLRAVDPYNLVTNKQTIFTNKPVSTFLTLPKADRLDLTTEAKLTTDSNYSSANDTFRIVDISQDLNLKTSITNKLASEVGEVDMYIPIPKKGQNWGANIQNKAFEYGFNLKGVDVSENPDFVNQFDISYASVDPSKLNGSLKGINDLKGETFTSSVTPSTNLVRIKSKTGKKIPASSKFPIALTLGLDNVTTTEDGKTLNWNAYYQADYASGTTADKGRNIEIAITLGKVGVTFFEDANSNGTKDGGEQTITDSATTPKIEVYNAQGNKENVDNNIEKTVTGYVIKGLVSDQNYTIKLISVDPNKRFTTGTGNENRSSTTEPIVPTLTSVADTALKPVGLTTRITLVQPSLTPVDDTSAVNGQEKTEVETAVRGANPVLPPGTTVTVDSNGDATVTFPDGYSQVLTNTVSQRPTSQIPTLNPVDTDDVKVSGTGAVGSTIEVILPDGSKKTTTVGADGKWEVALDAPLAKDAVVKATQTEVDKKPSGDVSTTVVPTTADTFTPATPVKTVVDNPAQLTPAEKTSVETAVKTANPTFPAGTTVTVADNGDVTITYPDQSVDTIPGADVIVERETSTAPTVDKVDTDDTKVTGTGVAGATIEVTLPDGSKKTTTVGADGKWEVALDAPLAKDAVVKATQTEVDKKPSGDVSTTVVPTTADTFTPATLVKTVVDNPAQLTPAEKAAVETAVNTANPTFPAGTTVTVADNGDVTITYPDGSVDIISGQDTVALKPVQKVDEKAENLPNTGTKSEYLLFGAAATSILLGLGLVKRNEDEEATN